MTLEQFNYEPTESWLAVLLNSFHFSIFQILIKNAIQGIVVGILLAVVVLIIATTNVIVGILATFTIAMITCSVLATITLLGWKLGVLESLNMTLVVGISVDYVVHLAEGYIELEEGNRLSRIKHSLGHVGISVLSGACSTLGASVFMLASKIVFFMQFGIFMFCTIGLSTIYSLLFFSTVLALVGPQDNYGSILPAVQRMRDFFKGRSTHHEDCQQCRGRGFQPKVRETSCWTETTPSRNTLQPNINRVTKWSYSGIIEMWRLGLRSVSYLSLQKFLLHVWPAGLGT